MEHDLSQRLKDATQKCNDRGLDRTEAKIVFEKLKKHYKLRHYWIEFTDRLTRHNGLCWSYGKIQVRNKTSYKTLCHEIAHAIDFTKRGHKKYGRMHTNRFNRLVQRVCLYCVNHNFWEGEVMRRTEIKVVPEPTKEELQQKKILHKENLIKRYERKLKLYKTKLQRARRSVAMLQKGLVNSSEKIHSQ